MRKQPTKAIGMILMLSFLIQYANAQGLSQTLAGINDLFYGVIGGIASLMLVFLAIKWKTAESPHDRESAKKGMITVIAGLLVVMLAGTTVDMLYGKKGGASGTDGDYIVKISTTTRLTTTRRPTTSTIETTTSTSSTTSTTYPYLTAMNLVEHINKAGGFLISNVATCNACQKQQQNIFGKEPDGGAAYAKLRKWDPPSGHPPCSGLSGIPTWCSGGGQKVAQSCNTLPQLNNAYGFGLQCKPGYTYYDCSGNVINC